MSDDTANAFEQAALDYHRLPKPGKLTVAPTKPLGTQRDLALAYSPGVAAACEAIAADPAKASEFTTRGNLVAVVSNGTAVLGLGDIGPLASKPVMEGKAVLFKKFAGIDVFDIELDQRDPEKLIEVVAALEPTFGAINLEDIKAPDCFIVERGLREKLKIPVFHDDQHGTAIVASAAVLNGLRLVDKDIGTVKVVSTGGGAAGIACLDLLVDLGVKRDNIVLVDHMGVVYEGRTEFMNPEKARYAVRTDARSLDEVIDNADVFLGLSAPGVLTGDMVARMADRPMILALANPTPEITPDEAKAARPDAVMATGRSDYPNQVNNVLCFPFIFRGALDVGATCINEAMKVACVEAIANLAFAESSEVVADAYRDESLTFGPEYLIPKPFDPRLILEIAPAVAKAAMDSGVATRPIEDLDAYAESLQRFVFRSGLLMKPMFERARCEPKRVVFAEGEDERVLRAAQVLIDEALAKPILVGRPEVVESRLKGLGLRIRLGEDVEVCNPESDPRYGSYWRQYHQMMERKGITPEAARTIVRTNTTVIAALMVVRGEADAVICGTYGQYDWHLKYVEDIVGLRSGVKAPAAMSVLIVRQGTFFLCDPYVNPNPTADEIVEMTLLAANEVRGFGITPKVALIAASNFGSSSGESACKMRDAAALLREADPELEVEGEMQATTALDPVLRERIFPNSVLTGQANLLVMPDLDTANTAFGLLRVLGDGLPVGPILLGSRKAAHILTPSVTSRGIVNMSALAVVDAQIYERRDNGTSEDC